MNIRSLSLLLILLSSPSIFAGKTIDSNSRKAQAVPVENVYTAETPNIVILKSAPQFVVQLKSNATTGFAWFLREYDAALITPVGREYIAPDTKLMGAPGYEQWTFKVKPAGFIVPTQTAIRMVYTRAGQSMDSSTSLIFRISTQD